MTGTTYDQTHDARISRLEAAVATLAEGQANTQHTLNQLSDEVRTGFTRLQDRHAQKPWGILAAWAGVIITFVGVAAAPFAWGLVRVYETQASHLLSDGHPAMVQRVVSLENGLHDLDTTLQREMRILDERAITEVGRLDQMLQREMKDADAKLQIEMDWIKKTLEEVDGDA